MKVNIDIKQFLLHRYPFLFVDGVSELIENESITAYKLVSNNESFFQGHFPANPVFPGVLMVEALAQAACVLMVKSSGVDVSELNTYLTGIDSASFKSLVRPGDTLILKVHVDKQLARGDKVFYKFLGTCVVDEKVVCTANFSAVVLKNI